MKGTNILCMPISRQSSWRVAEEVSLKIVVLYNAPLISHRQLFKIQVMNVPGRNLMPIVHSL